MEADFQRFYGLTASDIGVMSWRRFETLLGGLWGVDGSLWVEAQRVQENTWKPSKQSTGRIVTGEKAQQLFAPNALGARRVEGPVNL